MHGGIDWVTALRAVLLLTELLSCSPQWSCTPFSLSVPPTPKGKKGSRCNNLPWRKARYCNYSIRAGTLSKLKILPAAIWLICTLVNRNSVWEVDPAPANLSHSFSVQQGWLSDFTNRTSPLTVEMFVTGADMVPPHNFGMKIVAARFLSPLSLFDHLSVSGDTRAWLWMTKERAIRVIGRRNICLVIGRHVDGPGGGALILEQLPNLLLWWRIYSMDRIICGKLTLCCILGLSEAFLIYQCAAPSMTEQNG